MNAALLARFDAVVDAHASYLIAAGWTRDDAGWAPPWEPHRAWEQDAAVLDQLRRDRQAIHATDRPSQPRSIRWEAVQRMAPGAIMHLVAAHFHVRSDDLRTRDRHAHVALARHIAMYVVRAALGLSYPVIGQLFGGRDHTTVMSAIRKIEAQRTTNEAVQRHMDVLLDRSQA